MYKELLEDAVKLNQLPKLLSFIDGCIAYSSNRLWGEMEKGGEYIKLQKDYWDLINLGFNLPKNLDSFNFFSDLATEVLQMRVK